MGTHDSPPGDDAPDHPADNQPIHQHGHHHPHSHDRGPDFDWEAMADSLELDGAMMVPLVNDVVRDLATSVDWPRIQHVLDVGCGPGVL